MKMRQQSGVKKMGGIKLGSTTIQWDTGRMNSLVVFLGATIVIGFLVWGINEAVKAVEGLPESKLKALVAFLFVIVGLVTFMERPVLINSTKHPKTTRN